MIIFISPRMVVSQQYVKCCLRERMADIPGDWPPFGDPYNRLIAQPKVVEMLERPPWQSAAAAAAVAAAETCVENNTIERVDITSCLQNDRRRSICVFSAYLKTNSSTSGPGSVYR